MKILYVEDEEIKRTTVVRFLTRHGHLATGVETAEAGLAFLTKNPCELLLSDVRLPGMDGTELLRRVNQLYPGITVLMVTAYATVDLAVEIMRQGAYDFLTKPFSNDALLIKLERIAAVRQRDAENIELRRALRQAGGLPELIGSSNAIRHVSTLINTVAHGNSTVLILGESGTGKEVVARALHHASGRTEGEFVAFGCAALPSGLVESELFGHERGAFTGATERRLGRFELADKGTLFLDDVDAMPLEVQAKLLRVLEERQVERVGSSSKLDLDVRVVASARPEIRDQVARGQFRQDLYYRLNVIPIPLPPLRERPLDIEPLIQHFLQQIRRERPCTLRVFSEPALQRLQSLRWPGNVRELRNLVERMSWLSDNEVAGVEHLPEDYRTAAAPSPSVDVTQCSLADYIERGERSYFDWALKQSNGNLSLAARLLGIPRTTLRDRLKALGNL